MYKFSKPVSRIARKPFLKSDKKERTQVIEIRPCVLYKYLMSL